MSQQSSSAAPIKVTDNDFDNMASHHSLFVVDFWAPWCGPCHAIAPIVEELAKEYSRRIVFGKLNTDENPATATRFGIMAIPTLLIMKGGKEVDRIIGVIPKQQIQQKLQKLLSAQ